MNLNAEFILSLVVNIIAVGVFIGVYKTTIDFMQLQITELKEDMRKYNNMLERMISVEQSTKSAHHRIDDLVK